MELLGLGFEFDSPYILFLSVYYLINTPFNYLLSCTFFYIYDRAKESEIELDELDLDKTVTEGMISPEMERGIGLWLLISAAFSIILVLIDYKPYGNVPLSTRFYVSIVIFVIVVGLIVGIVLGMAIKWRDYKIVPWTFSKKVKIIIRVFYLAAFCDFILVPGLLVFAASLVLLVHSLFILISIVLLIVYERLKLLWAQSRES